MFSTIDSTMIRQHPSRKKKLFVAFIDFLKAFDTVDRQSLWVILESSGISGKRFNNLQAMYSSVA